MKNHRYRTVVAHHRDDGPARPLDARPSRPATMEFREEEVELAMLIFRNEEWKQAIAATNAPVRKDRP